MIGLRPSWRDTLGRLGDALPQRGADHGGPEPVERLAPDTLAARIGAPPPADPRQPSAGEAPWRRALRGR